MSATAGIELALAWDEAENNGESAGTNASLQVDFLEEKGVLVTQLDKAIFGRC